MAQGTRRMTAALVDDSNALADIARAALAVLRRWHPQLTGVIVASNQMADVRFVHPVTPPDPLRSIHTDDHGNATTTTRGGGDAPDLRETM
jgi:hypothetical protein